MKAQVLMNVRFEERVAYDEYVKKHGYRAWAERGGKDGVSFEKKYSWALWLEGKRLVARFGEYDYVFVDERHRYSHYRISSFEKWFWARF